MLRTPIDSSNRTANEGFQLIDPPDTDSARSLLDGDSVAARSLHFVRTRSKGVGVVATRSIAQGTVLGRYAGRIYGTRQEADAAALDSAYVLDVVAQLSGSTRAEYLYSIDSTAANRVPGLMPVPMGLHTYTAEEQQSTWVRYINSIEPTDAQEAVSVVFEYNERDGLVYARAARDIRGFTELLADYGRGYFYADLEDAYVTGNDWRQEVLDVVVRMQPAVLQRNSSLLHKILDPAQASVLVLRGSGSRGRGQPLAVMVYWSTHVFAVVTVDVRNSLEVASTLFSLVYQWALTNGRGQVTVDAQVFESDELARRFYFERETIALGYNEDEGARAEHLNMYVRRITDVTVHAATLADVVHVITVTPDVHCPELAAYPLPKLPPDYHRNLGEAVRSLDNNPSVFLRQNGELQLYVASIFPTHSGVMVINRTLPEQPYVDFACTLATHGTHTESLRAYVLECMIGHFEQHVAARPPTSLFVYVSQEMAPLMQQRASLRMYRRYTGRTRPRLSIVSTAVLFVRERRPLEQ